MLVAVWGVHAVVAMDPDPESALRVRIEPIVMLFTALISVVTGVLFVRPDACDSVVENRFE